jgi:hypothetical protein
VPPACHPIVEEVVVTEKPRQQLPVVDVDQAFPLLTTDSAARRGSSTVSGGDQAPTVSAAIRDVLGWRPRPQDTKAFTAALGASFELTTVEGHVEARYVPRGFAVQADLGGITGGQASLYSRAKNSHTQITEMLESLKPLRPDADPEDCTAFRLLIRDAVRQVVQEFGMPGGPRVQLVDSAFRTLTGFEPVVTGTPALPGFEPAMTGTPASRHNGDVPPAARIGTAGQTADDVPGILGALRDRMGLTDDNVNTVDEEKIRTSFLTLVDLIIGLQIAWEQQRVAFGSADGRGFLGTELILINRLLAAAAEQVDELEAVLDSTLISAGERQTIVIDARTRLTLDGLLSWLRTFLTEDGPRIVQDTGRDGITTSFTPTVVTLLDTLRNTLVGKLPNPASHNGHSPVSLLPVGCCGRLPTGMYAARTRIAVAGLCSLLEQLAGNAAKIGRFAGVILFDVVASAMLQPGTSKEKYVRVEVRGTHLRPSYLPAFVRKDTDGRRLEDLVLPVPNSASADVDTMVAVFRAKDADALKPAGDVPALVGIEDPGTSWNIPASALPLAVVDGESGRIVLAPAVRTWPELAPAYQASAFALPDSVAEESQIFVTAFDVPDDAEPNGWELQGTSDDEFPDSDTEGLVGANLQADADANGSRKRAARYKEASPAHQLRAAQKRARSGKESRRDASRALDVERRRSDAVRDYTERLAEQSRQVSEELRVAQAVQADRAAQEMRALAALRDAETGMRTAADEVRAAELYVDADRRSGRAAKRSRKQSRSKKSKNSRRK